MNAYIYTNIYVHNIMHTRTSQDCSAAGADCKENAKYIHTIVKSYTCIFIYI